MGGGAWLQLFVAHFVAHTLTLALWFMRCPQVSGNEERPRLAVYRSNNHIYAQVCMLVWFC